MPIIESVNEIIVTSHEGNLLLNNTFNTVQAHPQHIHLRSVRETDEMMARAVEEISTTRGVQVKEDTWHHNHLLLQTGLEEVETVGNGLGKTLEVQPATNWLAWFISSKSRE